MSRPLDPRIYPGARFHRLVVIERLTPVEGKHRRIHRVYCQCDCGRQSMPEASSLLLGLTTSCGCHKATRGAANSRARVTADKGYGLVVPGARFARLTVIERTDQKVRCRCDCGNETTPGIDGIVSGNTRSCGCLKSETAATRNKTSGKFACVSSDPSTSPTYTVWNSMIARCRRPGQKAYASYGGVGVRICDYLAKDPRHLIALLGIKPSSSHTIDRFPVHDGHYCCGSCDHCKAEGWALNLRWATRKQQSLNRGDFNVYITAFGKTQTKSQWMEESGLGWSTLTHRIRRGWSAERALTTPDSKGNCYKPES